MAVPLVGQFYFGRNKIQYEHFDWNVLNTDHFDIYFYDEEEVLANAAAYLAEKAFAQLEIQFNHTLNRRVPLVIYSSHIHFQQTNVLPVRIPEGVGGFFEFIKGRVVIPYNGNMADFQHVIRHELVHVFMHSKILQGVNDAGLWDTPQVPLWFSEGLAEWWSDGWDSQAEMVIRDALLYDHLIPLKEVGGYLAYKEGQAFFRFYEERYGADRIRRLMESIWLYDSFEEAFQAVTGVGYDDVMTEWVLSLKQQIAASLPSEETPPPDSRLLTRRGINVSPTVYRSMFGELHTIYLSNQDGYTNIYDHSIPKDRRRLLVKGERSADLESLHLLQTGLSVNQDGILAFVSKAGPRDVIQLLDIKNLQEVGLLNYPDLVSMRSPSWSPDGKQIVFSAQNYGGREDLYLWDIDREILIPLTADIYSDRDPCFSPDGKWIVFSSDRGQDALKHGMDLFLLEIKTKKIQYLTRDEYQHTKPHWGRENPLRIYFISNRSGTPNVWVLDLPEERTDSDTTFPMRQVTRYHTGVVEAVTTYSDSLIINIFRDFSFQLDHIAAPPDPSPLVANKILPHKKPWSIISRFERIQHKKIPYRLKYTLDFAETAVAQDPIYGLLGGAQLSVSDLLGNRYYHFLIANTAQTTSEFLGRFNVAVTVVDLTHRTNLGLSAFHFANDYYDPYQAFYFERTVGLRAGMSYPFDVFHRLEFTTSFWESTKDYYDGKPVRAWLLSHFISLVHDNSLWIPVGPIDGWRARITVGPTFDFQRARLHNYVGLLDFRYYYRPVQSVTFAQRTMVWFNDGKDIRRFYIGGSWGIRGYALNEIYGRKLIMLNQELRFPFAQSLVLNFHSLAIALSPIRGAVFLDAGNAWDYDYPGLVGSIGFGLRGALFNALVLRLDIGKRTDFKSLSRGWFTQFFFGWDY
jgi:Tol biopolymer transport system component